MATIHPVPRSECGAEQDRQLESLGHGAVRRRGYWKAVVAIAAKNARMAWAVLNKGEAFKLPEGLDRGRARVGACRKAAARGGYGRAAARRGRARDAGTFVAAAPRRFSFRSRRW
jgi:hypothetical protein